MHLGCIYLYTIKQILNLLPQYKLKFEEQFFILDKQYDFVYNTSEQTRYYNPEIGRFISPDSTKYLDPESIHGLNLYAYCLNNPVMYADPSGKVALTALLIAFSIGAVLGGIYGGVSAAANGQNIFAGIAIGAVVGGLTGLFTEAFSVPFVLVSTFLVGVSGDIASQKILDGKSWGDINLVSAFWAGVANAGLAGIGKGLSKIGIQADLTNVESTIFGTITNSPLLAAGMAINLIISANAPIYTFNNWYEDTFEKNEQVVWRGGR